MKKGSCLVLMLLMLVILLIDSHAQVDVTPFDAQDEAASGRDRGSSSVTIYQRGFDKGYTVGLATGYQTGSSDVLKNTTTNMTEMLMLMKSDQPEEETPRERSLTEIYLSLGLLLFGLLLALMQTIVVVKRGKGWDRESIRLIGLTLVLTLGAVLLPVGYDERQITPLMTLLGIVAGYLLAGIDLH